MSGEGDSGDSSDYSAKPSTSSANSSRRITRRNAASTSASCSSSSTTRGNVNAGSGLNGTNNKKKRRIVMRIEFDDDSDESSSSASSGSSNGSGMSDDAINNKQISKSRKINNSISDSDDDEIKPSASSNRRVRGKLGKKSNFVFNSDDDDDDESGEDNVPVGGIRRRSRRNRQILEDDDDAAEEHGEGGSTNCRENSRTVKNMKKSNGPPNEIPTSSTSQQLEEENGFNSDSSSNELLEKCPICLLSFRTQEIGSPATCQHIFCANCIEAWSKNVQTCPIDRIEFDRIVVRESYENRAVVREIKVCGADCAEKLNNSDEDVTHCEVCNRPDREDVMLLCDSCNQGYHIDCLTPALSEIPEGSWYCDNCFDSENESDMADDLTELYADIRDMGIPETRLRVTEVHQPRILRTRQNERIRAAILSRTRASTRNQNVAAAPSTSRSASTSSRTTRTVRNSSRTTARVPKTRRRRRRRARQRTYVVEYDLNNYDEKFAIKTTKRVIKRRRRKRTRRTALSQRQAEILCGERRTASKRLAEQLGVKSTDRDARAAASTQNFSLFGNSNDLEYFSDSDDGGIENQIEISTGGGGSTAVQTSVRISNFRSHRGKKGLLSRLEREPPSSTPDLLSNIMDLQDRWHNASRHMDAVRIGQDGSLNLPPPSAAGGPGLTVGNTPVSLNPAPTPATTQPSNIEITQAPMYPRGGGNNRNFNSGGGGGAGGNSGGGGNYNNNRYNNQSNYRGGSGGGSGGGGGGGGNYRNNYGSNSGNSGSGLSGAGNLFNMVGRGNFSFSSQNQNDNNSNNNNPNNNNPNNRDRFNQRNNNNNNNRNNQRNSLPLFNNTNNQSNDNLITINQSPLQHHRQQNLPNMPTQNSQNNIPPLVPQFPNHQQQQQNLGMGTASILQPPPVFPLPPPQPLFGPHNQPMLNQPPPMLSMPPQIPHVAPVIPPLMANPVSAPPLPAPPAFNNSLFQLTADYDDDDDDSNCPNFSVYSMESLQVAKSDVRTAAESKGETPKEDDENEDLVQMSDDDEAISTNKDTDGNEIPLPPPQPTNIKSSDASEQIDTSELYEPDQPTYESDDENESNTPMAETNASVDDEENKDDCNNDIESQPSPSPENDMEIESQDSTTEKKVVSETSQVDDENEEPEGEQCIDEVASLSEITLPEGELKKTKRSTSRKGVLELYDDSDWEELNMERPNVDDYQIRTPPLDEKTSEKNEEIHDDKEDEEENMTPEQPRPSSSLAEEAIVTGDEKISEGKENEKDENEDDEDKEQDRSYTPCLDEKNEEENDGACTPELAGPLTMADNPEDGSHTPDQAVAITDPAGIAGMETELISEDDDSDKRDKNRRGKSTKDKEQFKKVSKNQKDRNYRTEKALSSRRRRSRSRRKRSRSRSRTNDKENFGGMFRRGGGAQRGGRFKRREIPRYNVRNVVNNQRNFKDRYGRDTSRPARSTSRTRRRRTFSRSVSGSSSGGPSPTKRPRRSFSMSPTPPRHVVQRRQTLSPRRRSRSPIRRSPIRRQSRTPLRIRSRSNTPPRRNKHKNKKTKRSVTPVNRTRSLSRFTPRMSRSRTPPRHKPVKRPKDRNKKKKKKRQPSPSPQLSPWAREPSGHRESPPPTKRKRHHTPKDKSPVVDQGWSPSPSPPRTYLHENMSWTPPLASPAGPSRLHRDEQYNEFPITSKPPKEKKKRDKKKKKNEKRRQDTARKEKRRREPGVLSQAAPSKEVFASGSNILVSVSFNKDGTQPQQHTVVTLPPTREEVIAGMRGRSKERQVEQQGKKKRRKDARKRKKIDTKPIAIIDLERSPFQVTQEPTDVIILTDSEGNGRDDDENLNVSRESGNAMMTEMDHHETSPHRTANIDKTPPLDRLQTIMEESYANAIMQQGPKTPPEPQSGIKFNLINKKQKQIRNVLHDAAEIESDENHEQDRPEDRDQMQQSANKIGPNTPPESGPCSPDVYDPFDPTKSPSMSPRSPTPPLDVSHHESIPDNDKHSAEELRSETRMTASSGGPVAPEKNTLNPVDLVMALMNTKTNNSQDLANKSNESQYSSNQVVNLIDENEQPEENTSNLGITVLSNVILSSGKNQHIPIISSPPLSKTSSNKPPQKVTNILSNLPGLGNRHNGDADEIESPYSPGSADYEDLFEPPPDTNGGTKRRRNDKRGVKKGGDVFENLFGSSPHQYVRNSNARKHKAAAPAAKNKHKMIVKVQKLPNEDHVKVYDDLPNSAVELQVKDKFLRKLNRQERVVEEVKMILKPRFNKKQITKDDYKEIMRRAVPKICHSKSGEINPKKIQNLIEAYVKKFRQKHRKLNIPNTGQVSSAVKCAAYLKKL
ncbi:uncharacterized protein LOC129916926 isoform X2 [Episyrphus balteatus]|uniref:uncharacterized protein LOC129916926 isoform X2 n=1 Tax=Episyrphus balteatus TaxID=286459 RepID=UPI00248577E2|nr:uncharacterized protein LOC129916926 isoform X2 [Episyrphus balteatus]